jgi:hypothetical protein
LGSGFKIGNGKFSIFIAECVFTYSCLIMWKGAPPSN